MTAVDGRPDDPASIGRLALEAALRGGQRPFVTFYDDASAERTELGHATVHNWVSKSANLLAGELELDAGSTLGVRLGTHWTTLVVLLAAWRAGLVVHRGDDHAATDALVVAEHEASAVADPERTVVVGEALGGRVLSDTGGGLEFGVEVLACGDEFDDPEVSRDDPALVEPVPGGPRGERTTYTHGDLLDLGRAAAEALDLRPRSRVLVSHPLDTLEGVAALLGALRADASVVLVASADPAGQQDRAAAERCDLVSGPGTAHELTVERGPGGSITGVRAGAAG